MKRTAATTLRLGSVLGLLIATSGCAQLTPGYAPPPGLFYQGVRGASPYTEVEVSDGVRPGPKQGQACATGVLGFAAWGDMSLDAAKKAGGIARVDTIDYSVFSVLGVVYQKNCLIITGE